MWSHNESVFHRFMLITLQCFLLSDNVLSVVSQAFLSLPLICIFAVGKRMTFVSSHLPLHPSAFFLWQDRIPKNVGHKGRVTAAMIPCIWGSVLEAEVCSAGRVNQFMMNSAASALWPFPALSGAVLECLMVIPVKGWMGITPVLWVFKRIYNVADNDRYYSQK